MKITRVANTKKLLWSVLLALGALTFFAQSAPAVDAPMRVAFLTVVDVAGAPDWRASALADSTSERLKVIPGWVIIDRAQIIVAENDAAKSKASGEALRASVAAALKADIVIQAELKESAGSLTATLYALQKQGAKGPQEVTPTGDAILGLPAALAKGSATLLGVEIPALTQGFISSPESTSVKAFELYAQGANLANVNPVSAEKVLRNALKEDPDYARAAAVLSKLLCFKSEGAEDGDAILSEALSLASQATKLQGASPDAHVALGRVLDFSRKPTKAVEEYSEALKLSPFEVTALNNRGSIFLDSLRQYRLARQDFESALTADQGYIKARINLGRALIYLGEGEAAVSTLQPMIETPPEIPFLQQVSTKLYIEALALAGRTGPATTTLEEYVAKTEDAEAPKLRALVQIYAEKYPDAIKLLEEFLTASPENAEAKQLLAWAHYKNNNAKKAIELLGALTTEKPTMIGAWRDLGIIEAVNQNSAGAKSAFASGIQFAPEDPELAYNAGVLALSSEDLINAEKFFAKATELDPLFAQAWYNLGTTRSRARKNNEAKEAFEKAAALSPEDSSIKMGLALSLRSIDPAAAKKTMQEAANLAKDPTLTFQAKLNLGLLCAEQKDVACAKEALTAASQNAPAGSEDLAAHAKEVLGAIQGSKP
jgi:tetratricopeptide (TPR) repeat protein